VSSPVDDPAGEEDDEAEDDRTLAEVIKNKKATASQEGMSSPGDALFPGHRKKKRIAFRKRKASASPSGNDDNVPG
jgi:hypothetical protein